MAGLLVVAVSALALMAAGCGGSSKSSSSTGGTSAGRQGAAGGVLQSDPVQGRGDADYLIASDLPLSGLEAAQPCR